MMVPWKKDVYEIGKEVFVNANFFISVDSKNISDVDFYYFNVGNNKKHTMYAIMFNDDGKYNVLVESRHSRDKAHPRAIPVDDNVEIIRAILKQDGEKLISLLKNE